MADELSDPPKLIENPEEDKDGPEYPQNTFYMIHDQVKTPENFLADPN